MTSDEQTKAKVERAKSDNELLKSIISNPVVEIVSAYVVIEYLQRHGYVPELAGSIAEAGCLTAVGVQQIAPILPSLLEAGSEGFKTLTTLLPSVAKIGLK